MTKDETVTIFVGLPAILCVSVCLCVCLCVLGTHHDHVTVASVHVRSVLPLREVGWGR